VRARHFARLTPSETRSLADLRSAGHRSGITLDSAESSLQYAEDHVFERVSVARDHEVLAEVLRHGRGHIRHDELKGLLTLSRYLPMEKSIGRHFQLKARLVLV
jgi:hypothetical protein